VPIGYPILAGCGFAMLMVAASTVFNEQLAASQIFGVAFILVASLLPPTGPR
jgi:multidrug transporter EmrE-like cation transporter